MFKSCLQRLKSVIFEGLVRRFGYGVRGERKKKKEKKKKKKRKSALKEDTVRERM